MKVLIVDDHSLIRRTIKVLLGDLVSAFYECSDGSEALDAYHRQQPDWVLMDIKMTRVDGLTAATQLTAAWPEAKILIVTSYDDNALREAARKAGACGYVLKENLLELRTIISRREHEVEEKQEL